MAFQEEDSLNQKAKQYSSLKYRLSLVGIIYQFTILVIILILGLSKNIYSIIFSLIPQDYIILPMYFLILFIFYYLLNLPLDFYSSFILERKFALSNQSIAHWFIDQAKAGLITYALGLICFEIFYYVLKIAPHFWWLLIAGFWILFNLVLARLAPVIIIPLFFKHKKMSDENLKERILNLANRMNVKILDVFEIDLSKKTLKANAAFVGMGNTRRVLLADTLKDKYTHDEIENILAHEFAHYRLRHMVKLVTLNSLIAVAIFYIIYKTSHSVLGIFQLFSLADISAMPIIFIYFIIFGFLFQPLANFISRKFERDADKLALETTGLPEAFIAMMEKLSSQNLADRNPHPIIKFLFF